jgi:hypothetical protein
MPLRSAEKHSMTLGIDMSLRRAQYNAGTLQKTLRPSNVRVGYREGSFEFKIEDERVKCLEHCEWGSKRFEHTLHVQLLLL